MRLEEYENLLEKIAHLNNDIKVEALLSELIDNKQIKLNEKKVKTLGLFRRGYRKDINEINLDKDEKLNVFKSFVFSIWREGIYDSLPKGIFHDLRKEQKRSTLEQAKQGVEIEQKEKQAARDFFAPIEQEFYNQRIFLELQERAVLSGFRNERETAAFAKELWELNVDGIDNKKIIALLFFLPYTFRYKGRLEELNTVFSLILGDNVHIEIVESNTSHVAQSNVQTLGSFFLGETLVLGQTFEDWITGLRIKIMDLSAEETLKYLPGRNQHKLLNILQRFFLPIDADKDLKLDVIKQERTFEFEHIDTDTKNCNDILGYTTFI